MCACMHACCITGNGESFVISQMTMFNIELRNTPRTAPNTNVCMACGHMHTYASTHTKISLLLLQRIVYRYYLMHMDLWCLQSCMRA